MATLTRIVGLGAFLAVLIYSNDALADSVKVVAILEAAARSMSRGGTLEVIDGG